MKITPDLCFLLASASFNSNVVQFGSGQILNLVLSSSTTMLAVPLLQHPQKIHSGMFPPKIGWVTGFFFPLETGQVNSGKYQLQEWKICHLTDS